MAPKQRAKRVLTETPPKTLSPDEIASLSPLGERLLEIRERIVASGEPFLNWDDLEKEIASRRGGLGVSALPQPPP